MRILPARFTIPNFDDVETDRYFQKVKSEYKAYRKKGILQPSNHKSLFIHQVEDQYGTHSGIAGCLSIQHYWDGKIKGHEATLQPKEEKQLRLLRERNAQIKPVLLLHRHEQVIADWITDFQMAHAPYLSITYQEKTHRIWRISSVARQKTIQDLFDQMISTFYIADGHHRTTITAQLSKHLNKPLQLFCTLFSTEQIQILPFHRLVEGVTDRSLPQYMKELSKLCTYTKIDTPHIPDQKHCLKMYVAGDWYQLSWRKKVIAADSITRTLDAALLDREILETVMQIKDIRNNNQIKYINGSNDQYERMERLVNEHPDRVGFCLPALDMNDFIAVVKAGRILPPKSTWFLPRMLNGLIVYELV